MKPEYRGSKMPRVLNCPGSLAIEARVAPRKSEDGFEGTFLHWIVADRCIRELGAQPPEGGLPAPEVPQGYKPPRQSLWMADWMFRRIKDTIPNDWSLLVECAFRIEFGTWISTGHHDIFAISPDRKKAKGKDLKTGSKPVEPAMFNEQANTYIVQAKCDFPELEEMEFEICQPMASEENGIQKISSVTLCGDQLTRAVTVLDQRVIAAQANSMELNPGLVQCAYCPGDTQCFALKARRNRMKTIMTPEMLASIKTEADDATLAEIAISAKLLEKPFEVAREAVKARIAERGHITAEDGTRITAKTTGGAYSVKEPEQFYRALRTLIADEDRRSRALSFPLGRITSAVAEEMSIPETGKAAVTASSIVDAQLKPFCEQGVRTVLQFT